MTDLSDRLQQALGDTYQLEGELGGGGMSRVWGVGGPPGKTERKMVSPGLQAGTQQQQKARPIAPINRAF